MVVARSLKRASLKIVSMRGSLSSPSSQSRLLWKAAKLTDNITPCDGRLIAILAQAPQQSVVVAYVI
jgi:hypothetical protein